MKLLLIRHAKSYDRDLWQKEHNLPDEERIITAEGEYDFTKVARSIKMMVPHLHYVFSSPLARTMQTAKILVDQFSELDVFEAPCLIQKTPIIETHQFLEKYNSDKNYIAMVGHENHLSELLCSFLKVDSCESFRMKKGGAALLNVEKKGDLFEGQMEWFFSPKAMRNLLKLR